MKWFDANKIWLVALAFCLAVTTYNVKQAYVAKLAYENPAKVKSEWVGLNTIQDVAKNVQTKQTTTYHKDGTREVVKETVDLSQVKKAENRIETVSISSTPVFQPVSSPSWAALASWAPWEGTIMAGAGRNAGPLTIGASTPLPVGASLAGFSPRPWKWQDSQVNLIFRF